MAHDTDGWPVTVYRYGAPGWGGKRAVTIGDDGAEQLRLAHRLGNDLVALSEAGDARMREWWERRLPTETAELAAAEAAAEAAWQDVARERSRVRRRDLGDHPVMDAYRDATGQRRAATDALKAAKTALRRSDPDAVKTLTTTVRTTAHVEMKAFYRQYAAAGLYWATINAVVADAKAAERRVISDRTQGRPARRRFKRWDGSGRIAVQLQRVSGDPRRDPATLATSKWRNVLRIRASTYGPRFRRVEFTTGSGAPMVGIDVVWHRDLPDGADICEAQIVAERVAGRTRYSVHFTVKVPPVPPVTRRPDLALHVGWRSEPGGAVRVGTWAATTPPDIPAALAHLVVADTHTCGRILLPASILDRFAAADALRSGRDVALNETRDRLAAWLDDHPQPPIRDGGPDLTGPTVRAWRSPARFAAVALAWRNDPRDDLDDAADSLEAWRRADRALWEQEANGRARTVRYRREVYRLVGAWIAGLAGRVIVDDTDLRDLQAAPKTGGVLPGPVEDRIAGRRADVAAGDLRATVVKAARREAVPVVEVSHKGLTVTHHACGRVHPADDRWLFAQVTCDGCGRTFDQDTNAAHGMLTRAVGVAAS